METMKKAIKRKPPGASDYEQDLAYWLTRTPEERIEAVEELRQAFWDMSKVDRSAFFRTVTIIRTSQQTCGEGKSSDAELDYGNSEHP